MKFILWLVVFLVGFRSGAYEGDASSVAICAQQKKCPSASVSPNQFGKIFEASCEAEKKSLHCDDLTKESPKLGPLIKSCDIKTQCQQELEFEALKMRACLRGYGNALIDTGVAIKDIGVALGSGIYKTWEHFKTSVEKRDAFLRQCNVSLSCKRDVVKDDPRYNQLSDADLNKISASFLYVQAQDAKALRSSLNRVSLKSVSPGALRDENQLTPDQYAKLSDLMTIATKALSKQYQKFSCYNSLAKVEMACYGLGNVVDPAMVFMAFKGARLAAAVKFTAEMDQAAHAVEVLGDAAAAEKAWPKGRPSLQHHYLEFSPTTSEQNERWISLAEKGASSKWHYLDVENSELKNLNDVLKDKNLVTSLTNFHKKLLFDKINALKEEFPRLKVEEYSDYKSSRFAFGGKVPKDLEQRLQKIFKETNEEFEKYLKEENIVRADDPKQDWFRAGMGNSSEQANIAARFSRQEAENNLQHYGQEKLAKALSEKLNSIESSRVSLRSELASTSMLDGNTLHQDVFDIVRKNFGDEAKLTQSLSQRFGLASIPSRTVKELQSYVKGVDEFSPGLFIPKREVAHLGEAAQGGFSADMIGLGSANQRGTAEALARSKNLDEVLVEARKGEKEVTQSFQKQKRFFEELVQRSVEPGKIKTVCSGDDCVAIAVKPLSEMEKIKILSNLAETRYSAKFRLAFIPEGVVDAKARNALSTHGESVEKILRSTLGTKMEPRKLQGLTFGIDMRTQNLNQGNIKLLIGEAPGVKLTDSERKLIQEKFAQSIRELNEGFAAQGISSSYRPF